MAVVLARATPPPSLSKPSNRTRKAQLPPYCGARFPNCSTTAVSDGIEEWRLLPRDNNFNCASGGSFTSLLLGDELVPAALCLRKQLLKSSSCPLVLVYDVRSLSTVNEARIVTVFGSSNLIKLEDLLLRATPTIRRARLTALGVRGRKVAGRLTNDTFAAQTSSSRWEAQALKKLWLFALPEERFPLACFVDLDVLIQANLDPLLDPRLLSGSHRIAAVSALGCPTGGNVFNSAVFVYRPSLATLGALLRRERSFERVGQACENSFTDQSLLNAEFRGGCASYSQPHKCGNLGWNRLSLSYNVNVQMIAALPEASWAGAGVAVIHFAGYYAKPWHALPKRSADAFRQLVMERERKMRERWLAVCSHVRLKKSPERPS